MTTIPGPRLVAAALILAVAADARSQERAPADAGDGGHRNGAPIAAPEAERTLSFWRMIGDPTLERLIADALARGPEMRAAEARVHGARAARTTAALDLAPAITASGGYTRQRMASPTIPGAVGSLPDQDLWDAGLRLSWDVDVFGRGRRSLEARGELVAAADEDRRDVGILLASEVAAAYFELRGAQDRLAVAERNAENQRGTLEITVQRLEGGRGTALDSERARAQLSTTLAEIPALQAMIATARQRLAVLTARPAEALAPALEERPEPVALPGDVVASVPDSIVLRRPDVRSAARQLAASEANVGAARAEYLPRLALTGGAGYTSGSFESLGAGGTPRYMIGPVITWPAFDVGRVRAGVDAARAAEAHAEARYQQTVLRARGEIETALIAYRRARERLQHLEDAADASERAAELARLRYTEGASDFLQVLDAERTLLEAQDRRANGRTAATNALVEVYRSLGGEISTAAGK